MDINSRKDKLINFISKTKKIRNIVYILLAISGLILILFIPNKINGFIITLSVFTLILIIENLTNDFKDMMMFQSVYEISKDSEDIVDIFEKTKETNEVEPILSKSHRKSLEYLYKIEKHIHNSTIKTIQSENLSNEIVVEVSKNLKNPVDNISKYLDVLKNDIENTDNEELEIIDQIEEETGVLKYRIEELFELTKVVTGTVELNIQKIDIKNLLKQSFAEYEDNFKNKNLNLKTNMCESKASVSCDGQQMWRVFEILLDNVEKYSKENSRVYGELYKEDKNVVISIINISEKELNIDKNEFLRLIREDGETKKMGIAIASNLVKLQNGQFDIIIDGDMFKIEMKFEDIDNTN